MLNSHYKMVQRFSRINAWHVSFQKSKGTGAVQGHFILNENTGNVIDISILSYKKVHLQILRGTL